MTTQTNLIEKQKPECFNHSSAAAHIAQAMGVEERHVRITDFHHGGLVNDASYTIFFECDEIRYVMALAPPEYPDSVYEQNRIKTETTDILGTYLSSVSIKTEAEGVLDGRSFVISQYVRPLNFGVIEGFVVRRIVTRSLLNWLRAVARRSHRDSALIRKYLANFSNIADLPNDLIDRANKINNLAIQRNSFHWCVSHNDLWKGNVLRGHSPEWKFSIIDWGGSDVMGVPFYDLITAAESFRIAKYSFRREIDAHCRILSCERSDVEIYLMAGLGRLYGAKGEFQDHRYFGHSRKLFAFLDATL